MLKIKVNTANTINYLTAMPASIRKAQVSATNKMAAQGLTKARKEIRSEYNVALKTLTGNISSRNNTKVTEIKKTFSETTPAKIIGSGEGIPLNRFKPKQKETGVEVEVKKGSPKIIKHAFGPKIKRLGGGVFQRLTKERLPIGNPSTGKYTRMYGPGGATMLRSQKVIKEVITFVNQKFKTIMDRELKYFLKIK